MMASSMRHHFPRKALLWGPGLGLLVCLALSGQTAASIQSNHRDRLAAALAASCWLALGAGSFLGEQNYRWS